MSNLQANYDRRTGEVAIRATRSYVNPSRARTGAGADADTLPMMATRTEDVMIYVRKDQVIGKKTLIVDEIDDSLIPAARRPVTPEGKPEFETVTTKTGSYNSGYLKTETTTTRTSDGRIVRIERYEEIYPYRAPGKIPPEVSAIATNPKTPDIAKSLDYINRLNQSPSLGDNIGVRAERGHGTHVGAVTRTTPAIDVDASIAAGKLVTVDHVESGRTFAPTQAIRDVMETPNLHDVHIPADNPTALTVIKPSSGPVIEITPTANPRDKAYVIAKAEARITKLDADIVREQQKLDAIVAKHGLSPRQVEMMKYPNITARPKYTELMLKHTKTSNKIADLVAKRTKLEKQYMGSLGDDAKARSLMASMKRVEADITEARRVLRDTEAKIASRRIQDEYVRQHDIVSDLKQRRSQADRELATAQLAKGPQIMVDAKGNKVLVFQPKVEYPVQRPTAGTGTTTTAGAGQVLQQRDTTAQGTGRLASDVDDAISSFTAFYRSITGQPARVATTGTEASRPMVDRRRGPSPYPVSSKNDPVVKPATRITPRDEPVVSPGAATPEPVLEPAQLTPVQERVLQKKVVDLNNFSPATVTRRRVEAENRLATDRIMPPAYQEDVELDLLAARIVEQRHTVANRSRSAANRFIGNKPPAASADRPGAAFGAFGVFGAGGAVAGSGFGTPRVRGNDMAGRFIGGGSRGGSTVGTVRGAGATSDSGRVVIPAPAVNQRGGQNQVTTPIVNVGERVTPNNIVTPIITNMTGVTPGQTIIPAVVNVPTTGVGQSHYYGDTRIQTPVQPNPTTTTPPPVNPTNTTPPPPTETPPVAPTPGGGGGIGGGFALPVSGGGGGGSGGGGGAAGADFEEIAPIKTPLQIVSDLIGYKTRKYKGSSSGRTTRPDADTFLGGIPGSSSRRDVMGATDAASPGDGSMIQYIQTQDGIVPVEVPDTGNGAADRAAARSSRRINSFIGGPGRRTTKSRAFEFGNTGREYAVISRDRAYDTDVGMSQRRSAVADLVGTAGDTPDRDRALGFNTEGYPVISGDTVPVLAKRQVGLRNRRTQRGKSPRQVPAMFDLNVHPGRSKSKAAAMTARFLGR